MTRACLVLVALAAGTAGARADVARYAVVVGNNAGDNRDAELRYAERDAERFASSLIDVGGFPAANVVSLIGSDGETFRSTLIALNDRIRSEHAAEAMLVVYYSGHGDAGNLHLGRTTLAIAQLEQLVRGSSATVRLLAVDACRSGVLTRVKGGRVAPPIPVNIGETLSADGVVFWTASAASEDAQESDEVQGSFFTHYLVSGLAGPADVDGDGKVTITEAFEYARAATLRASSRTIAGPQHATFRDELRGRRDIVLSNPGAPDRLAALELPPGRDVLVLAGSDSGRVVAELGAPDRVRRLAVRPGRYFVRERADASLLEGTIAAVAGAVRRVEDRELVRVAYAQLVRKGGRGRQDAIELGVASRSAVLGGSGLCSGVIAGYAFALPWLTIAPRVGLCREHMDSAYIATTITEVTGELRAEHVWDLGPFAVGLGGQLGVALLHESFATTGTAPDRNEAAPTFGVVTSAALPIGSRVELGAEVDLASYVFRKTTMTGARWDTPLALRALLGVAVPW